MTLPSALGRFSFGHLINLPRGAGLSADTLHRPRGGRPEPPDPKEEESEDSRHRAREEDQENDARRGRRAQDRDPEDEEEDDKGERRGGSGGGAEDEDENAGSDPEPDEDDPDEEDEAENGDEEDDEEEMRRARAKGFGHALKAARRAERRRIGVILSSKHALGRVAAAAHLACNTALSPKAAIGVLRHTPAARGGALAAAMAREPRPHVGPDGGESAADPGQKLVAAAGRLAKTLEARRR